MIVTPGTAFGDLGEGYVRIALVHPVETIEKVVEGEPEAIHNVVCYYRGYMKYLSVFHVFQGHYLIFKTAWKRN